VAQAEFLSSLSCIISLICELEEEEKRDLRHRGAKPGLRRVRQQGV